MKLTNRQLLNSVDSLTQLNTYKLPIKISFKIAKLSKAIDNVLKSYQKTLKSLQEQYADRCMLGEKIVIDGQLTFKDPIAFESAFQQLLDCETDVLVEQISVDALGAIEVEPKLLYHLDWLLKD